MYSHLTPSPGVRGSVFDPAGWVSLPRTPDLHLPRTPQDLQELKTRGEEEVRGLLAPPTQESYERGLLKIPSSFKLASTVSSDQFTQTEPSVRNPHQGQQPPNYQPTHIKIDTASPAYKQQAAAILSQQSHYNMNNKVSTGGVSLPSSAGAVVSSGSTVDEKCYRLDMCGGQPFSYNYALVNQMGLAYKCDICGLAFAHATLLSHHKRMHVDKTYVCKCGAIFSSTSDLKAHQANAHKDTAEACGVELPKSNRGKRYRVAEKCHSCEDFSDQDVKPSKLGRNNKNANQACLKKCTSCNGSGLIYDQTNRNGTEKPFQCDVCQNTFSRYSSLWSHKRLHNGDKPFRCDECGTTFAKAAYLKNHKRIHSGERPFKCSVCGQEFNQGPHLKNHERIHSGEKPYICDSCGKRFSRHSTLWNHRRIHSGERPYRCDVCGSAFSQGTHLKNHRKVHTGERPYKCDICDVGFTDRFALKRHRNVHATTHPSIVANNNSMSHPSVVNTHPSPETAASSLINLYKCEVGQVAFPGCSRPSELDKPLH